MFSTQTRTSSFDYAIAINDIAPGVVSISNHRFRQSSVRLMACCSRAIICRESCLVYLPLVALIPAERGRVVLHPSSAIRAFRGVRVVSQLLIRCGGNPIECIFISLRESSSIVLNSSDTANVQAKLARPNSLGKGRRYQENVGKQAEPFGLHQEAPRARLLSYRLQIFPGVEKGANRLRFAPFLFQRRERLFLLNYHRRLFDVKVLFINMDMGTLCKLTSSLLVPPSPENRVFRLRSSKEESASCEEMALRNGLNSVSYHDPILEPADMLRRIAI